MISLEQIMDPDGVLSFEAIQRNFDLLARLVIDTGGRSLIVRYGTSTVTVTNGVSANSANIAHGCGRVPANVHATAYQTADTRDDYGADVVSKDATNIVVSVRGMESAAFPLANPTTITFDWIAIA